ncbi:MAG: PQQ-dependent sugar dehydrogenase [Myxococcota bacterium]|nr:PQQ-dependent sugar dehydrogenase [Myxococcota bacterium]
MLRRGLLLICFALLVSIVSCNVFLPERFAVNAPMFAQMFGKTIDPPSEEQVESRFRVPEGFSLSVWAGDLGTVRWLKTTSSGDFIATLPRAGKVILLERDADGDGRSDGQRLLFEDLNRPHGIELRDGWLYIGETDAVGRVRFDAARRSTSGEYERFITGFPGGGNHWSRTLGFGPDGMLYVSIGSSCNVCEEEDARRAAIVRYQPDGSGEEIYAAGLRNAVGFDWQPGTGKLFATDNGRDLLGDDFPPCELNEVVAGGFYGWPYANGDNVVDPDFGAGQQARIATSIPPAHPFPAHNAPLGIHFVRDARVPASLRGAALVALHGSWNRTRKDGYKVVSLTWASDGSIEQRDFMTGFELDEDVAGRPVHVVEGPDGAFYVSDDYAGVVWRVAYGKAGSGTAAAPVAMPSRPDPLADLPPGERTSLAARGETLYASHQCATCHDPAAAAEGVAVKRLENLNARYDIAGLEALFSTPPSPMPIVPLSENEMRALAVYLLDTPSL